MYLYLIVGGVIMLYLKVLFSEVLLVWCLKALFSVLCWLPKGIFGSVLLVFVLQGIVWLQCALRYLVASCQQLSQRSKNKSSCTITMFIRGIFLKITKDITNCLFV